MFSADMVSADMFSENNDAADLHEFNLYGFAYSHFTIKILLR